MTATASAAHGRRAPGASDLDLLIVGAGFAGLYMLHRARGMGLSARVIEVASDVGGTWWWNRYPGARCDVESMQYSYSWDEDLQQEWTWSERFATQPEILSYIRHVAERHDLKRDITFETRVDAAEWDADAARWRVTLSTGERVGARNLVLATGCLSAARAPDLPGRDSFEGAAYHTGDWPHEGVDFTGKRVAVIGTGSSGIQAIPEIAKQAAHLTVFQRTPNFSVPARNQPLDDNYVHGWKSRYPELRRRAREETRSGTIYDFPERGALEATPEEREREYRWRWEKGGANFMHAFNDLVISEEANATAADFVRDRIREIVKDPQTAEALCPTSYPIFTKRICVDDNYFATYNRPNVTLVNLRETPLEGIEPTGVRTSAGLHEVDAIVYATGFDAITGAITAIDIRGRDGRTIPEKWKEGPRAYLGLMLEGFPNLFAVTGPGSPSVLSNMVVSIEQHVDLISRILEEARARGAATVEADRAAEDAWVAHVNEVAAATLLPRAASWYMGANIPGKPRVFMPYLGVSTYREACEAAVADGWRGFRFAPPAPASAPASEAAQA
ncbi:NAD(P)/FAD-dependent oxidoreductase [Albimonas sp. CAU 1670]|uniref:flavin-containing monooxygenase n=1 Tax=Albimonas sp. CAU 1670 TaxID=3032599 RepID=UPI0023DC52A4|nr:NAD(P)/FAD-dependent oxidoreductase [Albimonas sp. CAU 1670]MDF2235683.1 NAD(P)/FAD-dependent oxidoreductase [Albimonas sp. CAU 1670]